MTKLQTAIFLIKNGYVDTRYYNGKFQVKMNQKGKESYLLLNRLKELSKWISNYGVKIYKICKAL